MRANKFSRQFIKDGLIGLAVVFLVFAVLLVVYLGVSLNFKLFSSAKEFWWLNWWLIKELFVFPIISISIANFHRTPHVFFSPMPLINLIAFLALGSSGRSFEDITSRVSWVKPIILVAIKSWLIGVVLWPIILFVIVRLWIGSSDNLYPSTTIPQLFGGIGVIIGLLIGCLLGFFLNPSQRLPRILIGALASICVSYFIGAGILLLQWGH